MGLLSPQYRAKSIEKKKRGCARAPDIRTVVRDQIASFDDLRIVEGVFHVVVQVFAAHGARVRVSILECVFCRRRTSFEPFFFIYKIRERPGKRSRRLRRVYVVARTEIE